MSSPVYVPCKCCGNFYSHVTEDPEVFVCVACDEERRQEYLREEAEDDREVW